MHTRRFVLPERAWFADVVAPHGRRVEFDLFNVERFDGQGVELVPADAAGEILFVEARGWLLTRLRRVALHGDVNVFENLTRGDADNAVGRFDKIVALAAAVLAAKRVDEAETGVELFCFDQKACAVSLPLWDSHGADWDRSFSTGVLSMTPDGLRGWNDFRFMVASEETLGVKAPEVNSIFLVQVRKNGGWIFSLIIMSPRRGDLQFFTAKCEGFFKDRYGSEKVELPARANYPQ